MSPTDYYVGVFKKYADFSGRSRRSEYWYFALFNAIAGMLAGGIDAMTDIPIFYPLYALIAFIPGLAVFIRRLHDTSRSGWWMFIVLIPIIGAIVLFVFLVTDSSPGDNEYGPNPKDHYVNEDDIVNHLVD